MTQSIIKINQPAMTKEEFYRDFEKRMAAAIKAAGRPKR